MRCYADVIKQVLDNISFQAQHVFTCSLKSSHANREVR